RVSPSLAFGNPFPKRYQRLGPPLLRIAGDDRGVDGSDGDARHPIGLDVSLAQGLKHPRLVGTQRSSALQNEGDAIAPFRLPTARQPLVVNVCGRDIHGALPLKPAPWKKPYDAIMTRKCLCPALVVRPSYCRELLPSAPIGPRFAISQSTTILFFLMISPQRCASAWMKAAISAGLLPIGSTLAARNLTCTSGVLITSAAALAMSEANAGA